MGSYDEKTGELTVDEINGAIRDTPVVDQFILPYNLISQKDQIPDDGACAEIFQGFPRGTILTAGCEGFELLLGHVGLRVQFVVILLVKLPSDAFADAVTAY